jgi:hypothetical protein
LDKVAQVDAQLAARSGSVLCVDLRLQDDLDLRLGDGHYSDERGCRNTDKELML